MTARLAINYIACAWLPPSLWRHGRADFGWVPRYVRALAVIGPYRLWSR